MMIISRRNTHENQAVCVAADCVHGAGSTDRLRHRRRSLISPGFCTGSQTLGRMASEIAKVLRGKNKPEYTPHVDTGDYVVVVNAEKVKVSGKKLQQKIYYNHSDYVGGMKETTLAEMMAKKPEKVIELAVKGMLPKGPMGRDMIKKLHVYAGPEHKQQAQKPEVLTF